MKGKSEEQTHAYGLFDRQYKHERFRYSHTKLHNIR